MVRSVRRPCFFTNIQRTMDLLSQAIQALHPRGAGHYRGVWAAPWGVRSDDSPAQYHVVLDGRCALTVSTGEGTQLEWLEEGDAVMLPPGAAYTLGSAPDVHAQTFAAWMADPRMQAEGPVLRIAGSGSPTVLVCGYIDFEDAVGHPLLDSLPPYIIVRKADRAGVPWLEHTLSFMACEAESGRPGAEATIAHLSSVLFVQALRTYLARDGVDAVGWLRAAHDPYLSRTLRAVQAAPDAPWTTETMAGEAGLSRSAFAKRFSELMGEPPMTYLTRWRMRTATRLLRAGDTTMAYVAEQVGYGSEAAFSRAFKRELGHPPSQFRRRAQAA